MCTRSQLQQDLSVQMENRKGKRVLKIKLSSYTCEIKNRQLADKKTHLNLNESGQGQSCDVGMHCMHLHLRACIVSVLSMRVEHAGGSQCHCRDGGRGSSAAHGLAMAAWELVEQGLAGVAQEPAAQGPTGSATPAPEWPRWPAAAASRRPVQGP